MHMKEVTICYGMTETSPVSFQSSPDNSLQERVTTVGRVHPHIEAKIVDPQTGCVLPRGIPGKNQFKTWQLQACLLYGRFSSCSQ